MDVVVGVDVGTTSAKAAAVRADGGVLTVASQGYPLLVPEPGHAELDPEAVRAAVRSVVVEVLGRAAREGARVSGVCLSAAMHGLVAMDADGTPRGPLLTWADGRAAEVARTLRPTAQGARLHGRSGAPVHPMSPLVKLAWLREHGGVDVAAVPRWGGVKELALSVLTPRFAVDLSCAGASGLVDAQAAVWDVEALRVAGVEESQLAEVVGTTEVVGELAADVAREAGAGAGVPVVVGASDGVLGSLGTGAVASTVAAVSLGTSGALRVTGGRFVVDDDRRLFCYALAPGLWVSGGAVNNAGSVLRWASRAFGALSGPAGGGVGPDDGHDDGQGDGQGDGLDDAALDAADAALVAEAARVAPGADGLLALPYLLGERAPWWNADLSGAWLGLRRHHGRGHLVRAGMEGVCLQLALVQEALTAVGSRPEVVRATGGALASELWAQLLASALELPVELGEGTEGSASGAALLGHHALGALPDLQQAAGTWRPEHIVDPVPEMVAIARRRRPLVTETVTLLADVLRGLSAESEVAATD